MSSVAYGAQLIGTNLPLRIARGKGSMEQFLITRILPEVGRVIQRNIISKMEGAFKNSKGKMKSAVKTRVIPQELAVIIYNDIAIAPYAKWQEIGVRPHSMTYLLNHKSPNVIPYRIVGGKFTFAGEGSKGYGKKGVMFATVTAKALAAGKFFHPGYDGKYLYREGMKNGLQEISLQYKSFTYRMLSYAAGTGGEGVQNATS